MTTEAAGLGLTDVLAAHLVASPRGYAGECCLCGWESDLEQPPEGQGIAHVAEEVRTWLRAALTSPEVELAVSAALRDEAVQQGWKTVPWWLWGPGSWVSTAALAAAAETLGAK